MIFDLDGTIADTRHRLHFLNETPKNWQGFFDACKYDTPYEAVVSLLHMLLGQLPIFIFSARPDFLREVTLDWLHNQNIFFKEMLMRADNDRRPDAIIKKHMLDFVRSEGFNPIFAVEDRPEVVAMWRENNVPCFVVNQEPWVGQIQRSTMLQAADIVQIASASMSCECRSDVECLATQLREEAETFKW